MARRILEVIRIKDGQMGRKVVEEIECDRCTRVEHRAVGTVPAQPGPAFKGSFDGVAVEYKDLCLACHDIIHMRWIEIARSLKKQSPQRDRTKKIEEMTSKSKSPCASPRS